MPDVETVVPILRDLARQGKSPSVLLHFLAEQSWGRNALFLVMAMRAAFDIPLRDLSIIGGWLSDGTGEIDDARIDKELGPAIVATYRD